MKKFLIKNLVVTFCLCFFFGCNNNPEGWNLKKQHLENVDALFVVNPTYNRKSINDNWVYLDISERAALTIDTVDSFDTDESAETMEFVEHTIPFTFDTTELKLKSAETREAERKPIPPSKFMVGEEFTFYDKCKPGIYTQKQCVMKKEGKYCYIWVDINATEDSTLSDEQIETFAEKFDVIYEKEIALCGPKYTGECIVEGIINPFKKVSLVLFDIDGDKGNGNIYGYFHGADFWTKESYSYSNAIEAIYVDSYYAKKDEFAPELHSTIAHEFNHMLNYVNKVLKYKTENPTWFTEMLSMMTEDFFMDDQGVAEKKSVWQRYYNIFFKSGYNYGFGNWRDVYTEANLTSYNYANAYCFGAFLARNFGGAKLIHEMATNEFVGEKAVIEAVNKINGTKYTFTDLLMQFELVLVNLENENPSLPSLAKSTEDKLDGYDFVYKLKPVSPSKLFEIFDLDPDSKIVTNKIYAATDNPLDSFGFQFYKFDSPTTVDIKYADFLKIQAFRK